MGKSMMEHIALLPPDEQVEVLAGLDMDALMWDWTAWARPEQRPPDGHDWSIWLYLAGRGAGKTRSAAEWVRERAKVTNEGQIRFLLVARTAADVRDVIVEGDSGIINVSPPSEKPHYEPSKRRLTWPNGNTALLATADEPDGLRGVQANYSWADELAAWRQSPDAAGMTSWDNLRVATRLGPHPQIIATTTPKRVPVLYSLIAEAEKTGRVVISKGSTMDNAGNLSETYLEAITGVYAGTRLAQQELYGEMLDDVEGALWTLEMLEASRQGALPPSAPLRVIGVDPSVAENPRDECGIIVCASTADRDLYKRHAWVMEDASILGSPEVWANKVVEMARRWGAPVVAEVNQGGALVRNAINSIDPSIKVFEVHAKNGKALRAEPIVLAYQQNRIHHIGYLPDLEAQMTSWIPGETRNSPDRVDACLAKGTLILTRRGSIPIEDVVVGDEVWTPSGWKRTSGSQLTARMQTVVEVETSDGSAFTATPDHVVWASGGWTRVDALVYGDTLRSCRQESLLSGMESSGRGIQTALSETKGSITSVLIPRDIEVSMLPYGSSQTTQNPFPQDMSSIMSITTQTTTIPTIWSASPEKSMLHSMKKKWHLFTLKSKKSIFPESGILHQNGMDLKQAWRGTESMEKEHGRVGLLLQKYALNAGKTLRHGSTLPDSAQKSVLPDGIAKSTDIRMMLTAQSAEHLSSKDKEKDLSHAVVSVERLTVRPEKIDVYDIVEVEDENCFYANGILVHNCVHALTALLIKPPQGFLGGKLTAKSPAARRIPSDRGQGPSGSGGGRSGGRGGRIFSVR